MIHGLPPIKGFLPSSLIEWEGRVSCAIFLPGCNFRCPFCHASRLVTGAAEMEDVPFDEVAGHLRANQGWIDGVVVSGGEPTLHRNLADLIAALREHVHGIKLDTNGSNPDAVAELVQRRLIDFVAMDVKAPLGDAYRVAVGVEVDCSAIARCIELLCGSGVGHEFRTTVVPGLHTREDIVGIARLLGPHESLILQQFAPLNCLDPSYLDRRPYDRTELRAMADAAGEFVAECRLRGDVSSCELKR
jgi:pyruvate formate lyase activating enzyme